MRKAISQLLYLSLAAIGLVGCGSVKNPPSTVKQVNLSRYMGRWYEIASLPNPFQRGCRCTRATYTLENKRVRVVNQCYKGDATKLSTANGVAWSVAPSNAKLKVRFFWPFSGDYWILALSPDYQVALVGSPSRRYLWLLSRQKQMKIKTYLKYAAKAKALGYDLTQFRRTDQSC